MTPHIAAQPGDFAPDILMPGDPLRARHISKTFFDEARLVTAVRGIEGYTGTWNGRPVSVMASGMGIPSISIYATELFRFYDAQRIIRIGTCGAIQPHIGLGDVVIATSCTTDSAVGAAYGTGDAVPPPSPELVERAVDAAARVDGRHHAGAIHTSDLFYHPVPDAVGSLRDRGVLAVEMEAAGLCHVAALEDRAAATILTVSDVLHASDELTTEERERNVTEMTLIALNTLSD